VTIVEEFKKLELLINLINLYENTGLQSPGYGYRVFFKPETRNLKPVIIYQSKQTV